MKMKKKGFRWNLSRKLVVLGDLEKERKRERENKTETI